MDHKISFNFDQTARDFLETESTLYKILMKSVEAGFDPSCMMMRSYIRSLQHRHPIDALKNCDTDIERALLNLAFHFRDYSHHAKSNCALSHATYTDLLDQFRLVMDTYR